MKTINPLTINQVKALNELDTNGDKKYHCRFLTNGQAADILEGELASKGSNVIHHVVYWDLPNSVVNASIELLEENNPGLKFRVEKELA